MQNINDFFPSNYLKAADLGDKERVLTIKSLEGEHFENGEKPVLSFNETEKRLILNRTNANAVAQLYGNNTQSGLKSELSCSLLRWTTKVNLPWLSE